MDKPLPAFGEGHDDATPWGIAAFVEGLPALSPERHPTLCGGAHHDAQGGAAAHGAAQAAATAGAAQPDGTTR